MGGRRASRRLSFSISAMTPDVIYPEEDILAPAPPVPITTTNIICDNGVNGGVGGTNGSSGPSQQDIAAMAQMLAQIAAAESLKPSAILVQGANGPVLEI